MSAVVLSVRRRDLAWVTAVAVLLSAVWVARGDVADAGGSPPGVGIAVVYVAVGTNFPDSLGVGPGGGVHGAPIIIVPTDPPIPSSTAMELVRLDPRRLVIVGGTGVVSEAMEDAIAALLPNAAVERIGGANRYETNVLFSRAVFPVEGWASIPAAALTATNPDVHDVVIISNLAFNADGGVLYAPIQLPDGAEILELQVSGTDNDASNLSVELYRVHNDGTTEQIAEVASSATPGVFTVSSTAIVAGREIVDNQNHSYLIIVGFADGDPVVRNVMVRYRLGAP